MDFQNIINIIDKGGTLALLVLAVWYFNTRVTKLETINIELRVKYEELLVKVGAVETIKDLETILDRKLGEYFGKSKK